MRWLITRRSSLVAFLTAERHGARVFAGRTLIPAPHGHIEALYRPADETAARVALILHPHPLFGGTMHNKVVFQTAKALEAAGFVTLRINFRGVGGSSGVHDGGRGEVDDARLGLDFLLTRQPAAHEVVVAGFSFGAAVGLRFGCADSRVQRVVAVGTPARWLTAEALKELLVAETQAHFRQYPRPRRTLPAPPPPPPLRPLGFVPQQLGLNFGLPALTSSPPRPVLQATA